MAGRGFDTVMHEIAADLQRPATHNSYKKRYHEQGRKRGQRALPVSRGRSEPALSQARLTDVDRLSPSRI